MLVALLLNSIVWAHDSTHALPFGTVLFLISVYFVVCIPLSLLGGYIAVKSTNSKPSFSFSIGNYSDRIFVYKTITMSPSVLINRPLSSLAILAGGLFPFIIIYVELQYVYKSLWLEKTTFYYFYGFLLANILLLCIVICEISIIGTFILLNSADKNSNNWRWTSFQIGASCAFYMEVYSLYYVFFILNIRGFSSIFISVCYGTLFNIMCGCATGSIACLTSHWFVQKIYKMKYHK